MEKQIPTEDDSDSRTPFERFEALTRGLLSVPKADLDKRLAEEKAEKAGKARSPKKVKSAKE